MPATASSVRRTEPPGPPSTAAGPGPTAYSPMSSCQSSGLAATKSPSSVDAFGVVEQHDPAPVLGHPGVAALEVARLADHDRADAELAQQPAAVPAGRERRDHDAIGVVAASAGGSERGRLCMHRGVAVLDAAVVPTPEQRPVFVEERGADRDAALGEAVASLGDGDLEHARHQCIVECARTRDLCSAERVMSTTADRTYTTTVGSQKVRAPARPAQRPADHRTPHLRRHGCVLRGDRRA